MAESGGKKAPRKTNWLEKMREKKEQRKPSALQKQAAEANSASGEQSAHLLVFSSLAIWKRLVCCFPGYL